MKYAILGPRGRINRVLDEPNERTAEITDDQAALVAAATLPNGYFLIDGQFLSAEEHRLSRVSPEKRAAQLAYAAASEIYDAMPAGKRALWETVRVAVAKAILAGDFAEAIEILETMPVIYEGAEADRQVFLNLFTP